MVERIIASFVTTLLGDRTRSQGQEEVELAQTVEGGKLGKCKGQATAETDSYIAVSEVPTVKCRQ